jgi:hypothetical protein
MIATIRGVLFVRIQLLQGALHALPILTCRTRPGLREPAQPRRDGVDAHRHGGALLELSQARRVFSVFCFLFSVFCFLFSVFCFLFSVFCFLFSVFCFLFSVFCFLFGVGLSLNSYWSIGVAPVRGGTYFSLLAAKKSKQKKAAHNRQPVGVHHWPEHRVVRDEIGSRISRVRDKALIRSSVRFARRRPA